MNMVISLLAIPAVAVGSVILISAVGGRNARKKVQDLKNPGSRD